MEAVMASLSCFVIGLLLGDVIEHPIIKIVIATVAGTALLVTFIFWCINNNSKKLRRI